MAIGKLNLAITDGRAPRLVLDSSVPNVNTRSAIKERVENPSLTTLRSSLAGYSTVSDLVGFSLDVKAAHKQVLVREAEQGLLMFRHNDKLYAYRSCHFGGKFSAYWWARVGALLHRLAHECVHINQIGLLFVDDWLWLFEEQAAPLIASMLTLFLVAIGVPLSWTKAGVWETAPLDRMGAIL